MPTLKFTGRGAILREEYGGPYIIENQVVVREPKALEVLVHLEVSGVCYGDLFARDGGPPAPPHALRPLTGGHEGVGRIVKLGDTVSEATDLAVGDHVGLGWRHSTCGYCEHCVRGEETVCTSQKVHGLHTDGTFQEYLCVPGRDVVKIPKGLSSQNAAPIICAGATVLSALRSLHVNTGNWVCVSGAAGGLGHLAIQYAKFMGLQVLAIDLGNKEEFCCSLGADAYFDYTATDDLVRIILEKTGGGVHGTLVLGRSPNAYRQALLYSRGLAAVVAIGTCQIDLPLGLLQHKGLRLIGQTNATRAEIADALEIAAQVPIQVVKEERPLEDINDALDCLKKGEVRGRIVLHI